MEPTKPEEPEDMEIFDEQSSRDFSEQHMKDMDEAARTIRSRGWMGMGFAAADASAAAAGREQQPQPTKPGKGLAGKMSSASSLFSWKKTATNETESVPPPPPGTTTISTAAAPAAAATTTTAPPPPLPSTKKTTITTSAETTSPTKSTAAQMVAPEIKVLPFEVREPSLGAAIVGQLVILEGSCYVWAAAERSAVQGSLAAAVATRFDGGMPVATRLLAGMGAVRAGGEAGDAGGGLGVSMAQRLCKRTGRVVFVSCDLPEDSQLLVAAVEGKVVKMLKADEAGGV